MICERLKTNEMVYILEQVDLFRYTIYLMDCRTKSLNM